MWKRLAVGACSCLLTLAPGLEAQVTVQGAARDTLYAKMCGRVPGAGRDGIVAGRIMEPFEGKSIPAVPLGLQPSRTSRDERPLSVRSGEDGIYVFCSVPAGVEHRLTSDFYRLVGEPLALRVERGEVLVLDLEVEARGAGRLRGRVRQGDGEEPVQGAQLVLDGPEARRVLSDQNGRFDAGQLTVGVYRLRVGHVAFRDLEQEVLILGGDQVVNLDIRLLHDAIALDAITVEVEGGRPTWGPLADVYDRMDRMRQLGMGRFFDRKELEESGAMRISHVVARIAGVRTRAVMGSPSLEVLLNQNRCLPSIYIDGIRARAGATMDDIPLGAAEVVEVYRRMSQLPGEFADEQARRCGAVAVWTRRGR